jgi:hypothetical protein
MCLDASQNKSYPTDLPVKNGLLVWLDAADDSTFSYSSGTEVSQWRDKSGNNFHANQATTANQPSRNTVVNSRKSVNFTSANGDRLRVNSGMVFTNSVTAIVFIKPGTQNFPYADILDQDHAMDGYNGWVIQRNNDASQWLVWLANEANTTWLNTNAVSYADNTPQIVTLRKGSSTLTLSSNGTSSGDVAIADQQIRQAGYLGLNIGSWRAGNELFSSSRHYNGEICEIVVYNRTLSLTELKQVHTYLGQKWGISNTDRSIIDLSGNNYSGSFGGAAGSQTVANMPDYDFYNKGALTFNGSSDEVNFGDILKFTTSQDFTLEVWVNYIPNSTSYVPLLSKEDASTGFGYALKVDETYSYNPYLVLTGPSAYRYANININDGLWHHIVGVAKSASATIDMYVDGVLRNGISNLVSWTGTPTSNVLRLGKNVGSAFFKGKLSNSKIYNRALSATEISQNYEAQKSKFANTIVQQGLVLNLDAGNPYSYAGAGTTIYDVSGNNYSGSLISGSSFSTDGGGSITFNGTNQYVLASAITSPPTTNFTLNVWATFVNVTADRYLLSFGRDIGTNGGLALIAYGFDSVSDKLIFELGSGYGRVSSDIVPAVNTWYHIVVTADGTNTKIYINGVLKNTASQGTGAIASSPALSLGSYVNSSGVPSTYFHSGSIALFNLYNRALSDTEVLQNYNATKGRFGL